MHYDLHQVELVVLTSSDAGSGAFSSANSYGLVNAFKQAGVKSILYGFGGISDQASVLLVREFYMNIAKGMNKRVAFRKAQEKLKAIYKEPEYWGVFVMLD